VPQATPRKMLPEQLVMQPRLRAMPPRPLAKQLVMQPQQLAMPPKQQVMQPLPQGLWMLRRTEVILLAFNRYND
jgi:hypothetical protein